MSTALDLLMLGHLVMDPVIVDGEVETVSGGGVYYGSVAARRLKTHLGRDAVINRPFLGASFSNHCA